MNNRVAKRKILIVGGGFAGIKAAIELSDRTDLNLTLISERSDFFYFPTLYHTATGGNGDESAIELAEIFADRPVQLVQARAKSVDRDAKILTCDDGSTFEYDDLILALGVVTNYFGIPGLQEYTYGIKTLVDAERFKRHLHAQLIAEHKPDLHYVIVGGGPTGIELAGNLGAYMKDIMEKHDIRRGKAHIDLVEAGPRLMPRLPKKIGRSISRRLRSLGVKLYLDSRVEGATAEELTVSGKPIRSHTIVWTAGVANSPFYSENNFELSPRGKVIVDEFFRAGKNIYVIGDNAETEHSGMAQTALYDGEFVAHNIACEQDNQPKLAYRPKKPIYITPVGPRWASVLWGNLAFNGWLGYMLRNLADLRGFLEIQRPFEAAEQWANEFEREDLCPICGSRT